ncbi:hypothetical protein [Lentzea flava]|uniref:Transposase n=1 Tax=Lentzea flava TaxID=103732 RepID=A0ABQ2VAS2_9PSEU|nr:hypothetical protein [Lentzea flava]MCP2203934.1 hypothetical protein [Lentzea flava]GGU72989.1 hypothetical protein GCM10010178_75660 [Lentzea flava]
MPRKPAGNVRRDVPPLPRRDDAVHDLQGVSPRTRQAIRKLELARLYRGAVQAYVRTWRIEACGPPCHELSDGECREPWARHDDSHWEREQLEEVLHQLPEHAARELRRRVARIDNHHLSGCPGWRDCRWDRVGRTPPTWWHKPN